MPQWLEEESPKLARMFEHIVDSCEENGSSSNCYAYAMGRVQKECKSIRQYIIRKSTYRTKLYLGLIQK